MAAHLLEPAIIGAVAADEDRRLRVHCPRTNGGSMDAVVDAASEQAIQFIPPRPDLR